VLVVSRNRELVADLTSRLGSEGYSVKTSEAWDDAARLMTAFAPQVLVAELSEPGPVTEELFALRRALGVRLIVLSAEATAPVDADAHLSAGACPAEVVVVVQRICGRSSLTLVNGVDRRSPLRPKRGDVRPCPRCGFAQRFEEPPAAAPAWMCRNSACFDAEFVRAPK
jgi:hypothetical protein